MSFVILAELRWLFPPRRAHTLQVALSLEQIPTNLEHFAVDELLIEQDISE